MNILHFLLVFFVFCLEHIVNCSLKKAATSDISDSENVCALTFIYNLFSDRNYKNIVKLDKYATFVIDFDHLTDNYLVKSIRNNKKYQNLVIRLRNDFGERSDQVSKNVKNVINEFESVTEMKLKYVLLPPHASQICIDVFKSHRIVSISQYKTVNTQENLCSNELNGVVVVNYDNFNESTRKTFKEIFNSSVRLNSMLPIEVKPPKEEIVEPTENLNQKQSYATFSSEPIQQKAKTTKTGISSSGSKSIKNSVNFENLSENDLEFGRQCQNEYHFTMIYNCIEKYNLVKNYDDNPSFIFMYSEIYDHTDLIKKMLYDGVQLIMELNDFYLQELEEIYNTYDSNRVANAINELLYEAHAIIGFDAKFVVLPVDVHRSIFDAVKLKNVVPIFPRNQVKFGEDLNRIAFSGLVFADIKTDSAKLMRSLGRKFDFESKEPVNFNICTNAPKTPQVIHTEQQKHLNFRNQLENGLNNHYNDRIQLDLNRNNLFNDSFRQISVISDERLKGNIFRISYQGESGIDAGGLTRDWYCSLVREMFNPDYALFRASETDVSAFQPNELSSINPSHLDFFTFVGRVIGKAIIDKIPLACHFSRAFYKQILGKPLKMHDLQELDNELYNSFNWIEDNDITGVMDDSNFTIDIDRLGEHLQIDLKPDGANIAITEANKYEYIYLKTQYKLLVSISHQINAFMMGFNQIIPHELIAEFTISELERLISGMNEIDVDDWERNSVYFGGYSATDKQIIWFWQAVRSFDQGIRRKLLKFSTGSPSVPLEGFSQLRDRHDVCLFKITKVTRSNNHLPIAHTCFNTIDLPEYPNYVTTRKKLLLAINEGAEGFDFR